MQSRFDDELIMIFYSFSFEARYNYARLRAQTSTGILNTYIDTVKIVESTKKKSSSQNN
jgi:hypothetical protein